MDAPEQKFTKLRRFIPRRLQPLLRGIRKRWNRPKGLQSPYREVFPFTQVSQSRQTNLVRLATQIGEQSIPGAIVECGVLDGGTAALMAYALPGRPVHMFDSWEGLPAVTEEDGAASHWVGQVVGSPRRVVHVMRDLRIQPDRLHFHRGWFHETFPKAEIDEIALLHIDADFYESVKICLDFWFERVSPGGFIQFDDYGDFLGCNKAVDDFLRQHPVLSMQRFGQGGAAHFIRKPANNPA